ncbi:MAG: MFS transporter [Acetobacterales bacterium]
MTRVIYQLTALFLGFGVLTVGNGLITSLLALRMGIEGFPVQTAGLIMSAQSLGFVIGPFLVPRMMHRVGHIRMFAFCAAVAAVATLTLPLHLHPVTWLLLRFATGLALSGCTLILESWLNHRTATETRGRVLGVYMVLYYLAFGAAQFLLLTAAPSGFELFSIAAILFALALLPIAATRIGEPDRPEPHLPSFRRLWRTTPLGTVGCFCAGFMGTAFVAAGPLFARARGMTTEEIATFMGAAMMAGLLLQLPLGMLSDRVDRRRLIGAVAALTALAALGLGFGSVYGPWAAIGAAMVYGGLVYAIYPLVVSHANDVAGPHDGVVLSAGLIFACGLGSTCGPLVAMSLMSGLGPAGMFIAIAAVGLVLTIFASWRAVAGDPVPESSRTDFVSVPPTTPAVTDLDPRTVPADAVEILGPDDNAGNRYPP